MDDDLRARFNLPRRDFSQPEPLHHPPPKRPEHPHQAAAQPNPFIPPSLKHAYQPPPAPHQEAKPTHPKFRPAEPAAHRPTPARKKRRLARKLIVTVLILGILGGACAWAYPKYAHKNPFPADIRASAAVQLLYPSKLPAGYTISSSSIHLDNGVLTYAANNGAKRIVFTTQRAPKSFDFPAFNQKYLKNPKQLSTAYGQAVIGQNEDRALGSLVSGQSWLILSTNNSQISPDNLALIMNSLKKY
jgi:hypothetical protein